MKELTARQRKALEEWDMTCRRIRSGTAPIPNETEVEKQKRIKMLLQPKNFEKFIQYYFAIEDTKFAPLAWFHWEAIENVLVKKLRKHIWELHREAAKSVFADIFMPIHMLCTGELKGLILASETEDKACNLIKDVEAHLRNNRRLIADFGDFNITGSWLQGYFQTRSGIGFWAFGIGQNPAGVRNGFNRPNVGIVDDADNKDKAKNQKLTKERVDWIKGEFMGCLAKDNRYFIYVNNRVHKEGLTAHLVGDIEEGDPIDTTYAHIKAHLTEDPKTHLPIYPPQANDEAEIVAYFKSMGAKPAWKEYYSLEDCAAKIVDYGYRNAMRQLYHHHIEEGNIFTDDTLPWVKPLQLWEYDHVVSYCDPAFGDSGKGCYRGIVLMGLIGMDYHVLWCWLRQKGSFAKAHHDLALKIKQGGPIFNFPSLKVKYKVNCEHYVESNELQKPLLKKHYEDLNRTLDEPWMPRFDMEKKADKQGRIESLEPIAESKHLFFNEEMRGDRDMITLRDQFKAFPDGFVDGPDAVEGAISKLSRKAKKGNFKARTGKYVKDYKKIG